MGYLISDIIKSFGLNRKIPSNGSANSSVRYACESKLQLGIDYSKNEDGGYIIEPSGVKKLRDYYTKRKLIQGSESVSAHNSSTSKGHATLSKPERKQPESVIIANKGKTK